MDYHSSYFRENPQQLLVYIKPLQNAEDWLDGIAVLIEHLIPVRIRERKYRSDDKTIENQANISKSSLINDKSNLYPKIPKRDEKSP